MIIHHKYHREFNIKHDTKTVREFIKCVIMKTPNKEKKYFTIGIEKHFEGKGNMILYFQDGKLKSHHGSMIKFDYKDILDYEIHPYYSIFDLTVENIVSVECDDEEELKERLEKKEPFDYRVRIGSKEDRLIESFNNDRIRNSIKNSNIEYENLLEVVKVLVNDYKELDYQLTTLSSRVRKLEEENEKLSQKIKWLGK